MELIANFIYNITVYIRNHNKFVQKTNKNSISYEYIINLVYYLKSHMLK